MGDYVLRPVSRFCWWAGWWCVLVAMLKAWLVDDPRWIRQTDPVAFLLLAIICLLAAIYLRPPVAVTVTSATPSPRPEGSEP